MNSAILMYDLRRTLPTLGFVASTLMAFILLLPGPLNNGVGMHSLIGTLTGLALSASMFTDTTGTAAYVYSRGVTRRKIFALRAVLGYSLVLILGGLEWMAIASGLRGRIHFMLRMQDAIYYPMSNQFETSVVRSYLLSGFVSFGLLTFYMIWRGLCRPEWNVSGSGLARLLFLEIPAGVIGLSFGLGLMVVTLVSGDYDAGRSDQFRAMCVIGLLVVSAMLTSFIVSRDLEVA